jgi:hypothetical protein
MRPWHTNNAARTRLTLFPTAESNRQAVWAMVRCAGTELALFCIVDDHLHTVLLCDDATMVRRARALTRVTRNLTRVEVNPTYVRPVAGRKHLLTLFDYILNQVTKHGLDVHPALWEGSCFCDLVGARLLPGLHLRIREALPRTTHRDALEAVGLGSRPLQPVDLDTIRALGAQRLLAAAAFAHCADPSLRGRRPPEVKARRAACKLAKQAGIPLSELAWLMGVTPRAARRMAAAAIPQEHETVVRTRLALELRVEHVGSRKD